MSIIRVSVGGGGAIFFMLTVPTPSKKIIKNKRTNKRKKAENTKYSESKRTNDFCMKFLYKTKLSLKKPPKIN